MTRPILFALLLAGCGSDYTAPSRHDCERAGGVLIVPYRSDGICVKREALIGEVR